MGGERLSPDWTSRDNPLPVSKKTPLRELQNGNRMVIPNSCGNSLKDKVSTTDTGMISGAKRPSPDLSASPLCNQSPSSSAANAHLVYVRRKSDIEVGKSSVCENTSGTTDSQQIMLNCNEELPELRPQIQELKPSCYPAHTPFSVACPMSSLGKPSIPLFGHTFMKSASVGFSYDSGAAAAAYTMDKNKRRKSTHWEERYNQLQKLLRNLEQSEDKDYLQLLRSFSSEALSQHAIELEKRSIQLSLEEAKEMQRVGMLNVLGRSSV